MSSICFECESAEWISDSIIRQIQFADKINGFRDALRVKVHFAVSFWYVVHFNGILNIRERIRPFAFTRVAAHTRIHLLQSDFSLFVWTKPTRFSLLLTDSSTYLVSSRP